MRWRGGRRPATARSRTARLRFRAQLLPIQRSTASVIAIDAADAADADAAGGQHDVNRISPERGPQAAAETYLSKPKRDQAADLDYAGSDSICNRVRSRSSTRRGGSWGNSMSMKSMDMRPPSVTD